MKKILLALVMVLCMAGFAQAGEGTDGFNVTLPMETSITAFYFPSDNTIAAGVAFTALRVVWVDPDWPILSKITLDLDANLAKEVNENKDTLYGPGIKANYNVDMSTETGFTFKPSLGLTVLRNMEGINVAGDLFRNWRWAIYGSVVLYKF